MIANHVQTIAAALTSSRSPAATFTTSLVTGDVVYFYVTHSTAGAITTPAGWVNVLGGNTVVASDSHQVCGVYHIVTSGEAGTKTVTCTNLFDAVATGNVIAMVVRDVDQVTPVDAAGSAFDSGNTITPHVLAAITGTGGALLDNSLVVSGVSKDATGTYTTPTGYTQRGTSNTNSGAWLGTRNALTTANTNVAATNITPSAGDEYASISVAFTSAADSGVVIKELVHKTSVGTSVAFTTPAFAVEANSEVWVAVMGNGTNPFTISANTGGLVFPTPTTFDLGPTAAPDVYRLPIFRAPVSSAIGSMTLTVTPGSGGTAGYDVTVLQVKGASGSFTVVKSGKTTGAAGEPATIGTLSSAAANGNTSVLVVGVNEDSAAVHAVIDPLGWAGRAVNNWSPAPNGYFGVNVYTRTDFTGTSVSIAEYATTPTWAMGHIIELQDGSGVVTPSFEGWGVPI
jgi:hypothetical protein